MKAVGARGKGVPPQRQTPSPPSLGPPEIWWELGLDVGGPYLWLPALLAPLCMAAVPASGCPWEWCWRVEGGSRLRGGGAAAGVFRQLSQVTRTPRQCLIQLPGHGPSEGEPGPL